VPDARDEVWCVRPMRTLAASPPSGRRSGLPGRSCHTAAQSARHEACSAPPDLWVRVRVRVRIRVRGWWLVVGG